MTKKNPQENNLRELIKDGLNVLYENNNSSIVSELIQTYESFFKNEKSYNMNQTLANKMSRVFYWFLKDEMISVNATYDYSKNCGFCKYEINPKMIKINDDKTIEKKVERFIDKYSSYVTEHFRINNYELVSNKKLVDYAA